MVFYLQMTNRDLRQRLKRANRERAELQEALQHAKKLLLFVTKTKTQDGSDGP